MLAFGCSRLHQRVHVIANIWACRGADVCRLCSTTHPDADPPGTTGYHEHNYIRITVSVDCAACILSTRAHTTGQSIDGVRCKSFTHTCSRGTKHRALLLCTAAECANCCTCTTCRQQLPAVPVWRRFTFLPEGRPSRRERRH